MVPIPRRAWSVRTGPLEFVVRPAAFLLFGGIAVALDVTFLPMALPGRSAVLYALLALVVTLLTVVTTLLHEGGHAAAYLLQDIRPVRITLRGSGAACAAMVDDQDTASRALLRALAGPVVTMVIVAVTVGVWLMRLPSPVHVVAVSLAVFGLFDLVFNTLPVHPRCDGTFALRALLGLIQGQRAEEFAVLYIWRPLILAGAALVAPLVASLTGYLADAPSATAVAVASSLLLCTVPPCALAWRHLHRSAAVLSPSKPGR